jgi:hypothetical protein
VFNAALAYAAASGRKGDVFLVLKDQGPDYNFLDIFGLHTPNFWEAYWNISGWVVDILIKRVGREVAKEAAAANVAQPNQRR